MNRSLTPLCLQKAIQTAKQSDVKRAKVAAIATTKSGEIISFANNKKVYGSTHRFTRHAEEVLITKLRKIKAFQRYGKINIFVIRLGAHGITMAKPCVSCQAMLRQYRVNVFYTSTNGSIVELEM